MRNDGNKVLAASFTGLRPRVMDGAATPTIATPDELVAPVPARRQQGRARCSGVLLSVGGAAVDSLLIVIARRYGRWLSRRCGGGT
ncbi:hypothetical protein GTS_23370 [Gandjariella thermophila]|uniref:Uncharacterized protein n=1 Tax=Gandjariella thermophila TaxID=1931992 RepID=A0A4D4J5G0_9PSEU|nr:hypothetical protein GTS_23370 [Gandjariella thermophila]